MISQLVEISPQKNAFRATFSILQKLTRISASQASSQVNRLENIDRPGDVSPPRSCDGSLHWPTVYVVLSVALSTQSHSNSSSLPVLRLQTNLPAVENVIIVVIDLRNRAVGNEILAERQIIVNSLVTFPLPRGTKRHSTVLYTVSIVECNLYSDIGISWPFQVMKSACCRSVKVIAVRRSAQH